MCDTHAHPTVSGDNHNIKKDVHAPPAKLLICLPIGPLNSYITTCIRMGQDSPCETYIHTYHHGNFISGEEFSISGKLTMSAPPMMFEPLTNIIGSPSKPLAQLIIHDTFLFGVKIEGKNTSTTQPPS